MKQLKMLQRVAVAMACLGLLTQEVVMAAGPLLNARIADVALDHQGSLNVQVTDAQGAPASQAIVRIKQNGQVLTTAQADRAGRFVLTGLRGGIYEMQTAQSSNHYRVWANGTAPPAAHNNLLLVSGNTVRAQGCDSCGGGGCTTCCGGGGGGWFAGGVVSPWVIGAVAATAIALPLALDDSGS